MADRKTPGTCPNCGAALMFDGQSICHKCGKAIADPARLFRSDAGDTIKAAQDALAARTAWQPEPWKPAGSSDSGQASKRASQPASAPAGLGAWTGLPGSTPQGTGTASGSAASSASGVGAQASGQPNVPDWRMPGHEVGPAYPAAPGTAPNPTRPAWRDGETRPRPSSGDARGLEGRMAALIVGGVIVLVGIGAIVAQASTPSYNYDYSFDPGYPLETSTDVAYDWPTFEATPIEPSVEPSSQASSEPSASEPAASSGAPSNAASPAVVFPATNPLAATGKMQTPRADHTATLLADGRVAIIGGLSGAGPSSALASVEIYHPKSRKFAPAGHLAVARSSHTATLLGDGRILVSGGRGADGHALATAEIYNPSTGRSELLDGVPTARFGGSAVLTTDGVVVIVGGTDGWNPVRMVDVFEPSVGVFHSIDAFNELNDPSAPVPLGDGRLLFIGQTLSSHPSAVIAIYRPTGPQLGEPDVEISGWGPGRSQAATCLLSDGRALIVGGRDASGPVATIEVVDPNNFASALDSSPRATMIVARENPTLTPLGDGSALIVGGEDSSGRPIATIERWDPATGRTKPIGTMAEPRSGQTATLLADGSVLIVGGRSSATAALAGAGTYRP